MNKESSNSFNNRGKIVNATTSTPGETVKNLNEAIMRVASSEGEDGKGKGGLVGYLRRLSKKHPSRSWGYYRACRRRPLPFPWER
jgi:hypothetical protein